MAGVYTFTSAAQLTGELVLNAEGNPNAEFVFQIGSKLTTASAAVVRLENGGSPCNVFWQVGSSATIGTDTVFVGNILALTSIALQTSVTLDGRALARNGEVTLDSNTVLSNQCAPAGEGEGEGNVGEGEGNAGEGESEGQGNGECVHGVAGCAGAPCVCDEGYAGDKCDTCAAGFQDNDGDGVCTVACCALDCGDNGVCDDSSGTAVCACVAVPG